MEPTVDLSHTRTPLKNDREAIVKQITSMTSCDDLKVETIDDALTYLYVNTIVDESRLFEELAPKFEQLLKHHKHWRRILTRGTKKQFLEEALTDLMQGSVIISHKKWDGFVIAIPLAEFKSRSVEQPLLERVLFGPKDSFTEDLESNISLVRRNNKHVNLTVKYFTVGERSKNKVAVIYYNDIANPKFVEKIERRIKEIHIDRVIGQKDLMELIIGKNQTVFPLYELVEQPARTTHFLNSGRVLLLIDGIPFGAMVPMVFLNLFVASEYFTQGNIIALFIRFIRTIAAFLALYVPSFYVALIGLNTTVLPTELGILIASDRASIPYPIFVEIIVLFFVLDIFLESTSYVPGNIGSALNIVGSLVIGQAAAQVNLVSDMSIIIIAVTAIGTYLTLYQLSYALRLWKYPMVFAAAFLGFYGIVCISVIMFAHLCSLKSFGVPYMSPLAPLRLGDLFRDFLKHRDISEEIYRKKYFRPLDERRQAGDEN